MVGAGVASKSSQQISGQGLQDLKMAMDEMLTDPASGFTGKAGDTIKNLRGQVVSWMEKANPDFKAARTEFSRLSRPINQMDIGQSLRDKLVPALADYGATSRLRPQAFAQALRNGDDVAAKAMGRPYGTMDEVLEPSQSKMLQQVAEQLGRRASAEELGKATGSNTAQNLISQNFLRNTMGAFGMAPSTTQKLSENALLQTIMRLPQFVASIGEKRAMEKLVELGMNPQEAARVLEAVVTKNAAQIPKIPGLLAPSISTSYAPRQGIFDTSAR
jgi:hypothetical protein